MTNPNYHGPCPYCASAISIVIRDGMTYARCSHRGCGARGPVMRDGRRAIDLFRAGRCVAPAQGYVHATTKPGPRLARSAPASDGGEVCAKCGGTGNTEHPHNQFVAYPRECPGCCGACNGTGRAKGGDRG